jgi:hypothetical protein
MDIERHNQIIKKIDLAAKKYQGEYQNTNSPQSSFALNA